MSSRPKRFKIVSELFKNLSLAEGAEAFDYAPSPLPHPETVLVLGLGPEPAEAWRLVASLAQGRRVRVAYVEAPGFETQMPVTWAKAIPSHWERWTVHAAETRSLPEDLIRDAAVFSFKQNMQLFPSFWGPILTQVRLGRAKRRNPFASEKEDFALLPGAETDLLLPEMLDAFGEIGWRTATMPADCPLDAFAALAAKSPKLFFSINAKGLDLLGERFHLLDANGVEVAVWLVDNPFQILSQFKAPFWKKLHLFVTDDSFIEPLFEHGATSVRHLPLAVWPKLFANRPPGPDLGVSGRTVFVGRSEFPNRLKYYSGLTLDPALKNRSRGLIESGGRPDYFWWTQSLGLASLWPNPEARRAGFGADESGRCLRGRVLAEVGAAAPLTVYGDSGWKRILPDLSDLRPPLDYYGPLPDIYAQAAFTLGATNLLLPKGLTQRHFDVWAAGGVLVTDANPGLDIFPLDLVAPIVYHRPTEAVDVLRRLNRDAERVESLRRSWTELILSEHTYAHRLKTMLGTVFRGKV